MTTRADNEMGPDAVLGVEAENHNQEGSRSMSKSSRKVRAASAPKRSVAADHRIEIRDNPEKPILRDAPNREYVDITNVFSADALATMPVVIRRSSTMRVIVWRGTDGQWYRFGGSLRIQASPDGGRQYVIVLAKGANVSDIQRLQADVAQLRSRDGDGRRWIHRSASDPGWEWVDDQTYSLAYTSRAYVDPWTHGDSDAHVALCDQALCTEAWHEAEYGVHSLERIERENGRHGTYTIWVGRALCEDEWTVDVEVNSFGGSADDVASFANDLRWAAEACRRANEAVAA